MRVTSPSMKECNSTVWHGIVKPTRAGHGAVHQMNRNIHIFTTLYVAAITTSGAVMYLTLQYGVLIHVRGSPTKPPPLAESEG